MYSMVMMMAMSGTTDTAAFGGKLFGGRSGCTGTTVVASCYGSGYGYAGCTGSHYAPTVPAPTYGCSGSSYAPTYGCSGSSYYAPSYGCSGSAASCKGGMLGGFLGLRDCFNRKSSGCHGSTAYYGGCTGYNSYSMPAYSGCTGYAAPANCCPTPAYSTGCTGSVINGGSSYMAPGTTYSTMPGSVITETPSTTVPAAPAGELKDMPKTETPKVEKKGEGDGV